MFTRRKVAKPALNFYGQQLSYSQRTRYLGIILDHRLNWTPQVKASVQRAMAALQRCRRALGPSWGLGPKAIKWLYQGVIRPVIQYACLIWCPALHRVQTQQILGKLQRQALVSISAAYPSTPTSALEAILQICLLYTSPSPRDKRQSRMPSSA